MKVCESNALVVQAIEIWRLEHGIPVTGEITITLIIGEDEDDVGASTRRCDDSENQQEENAKEHAAAHGVVCSVSVSTPQPGRDECAKS